MKHLRIVVVDGGWSHEANYSSAPFIAAALRHLGCEVISLRYEAQTFISDLLGAQPAIVFPQTLGAYGEDGVLQGLLDAVDISYVGSGVGASALGANKALFKTFVRGIYSGDLRFTTPRSLLLSASQPWPDYRAIVSQLGAFFVLKPAASGASFGLHFISDESAYYHYLAPTLTVFRYALAETFVEGRELTAGILEDDQRTLDLPVCEIRHAGLHTQTDKLHPVDVIPAPLDAQDTIRVQRITRMLFQELGCKSYLRVDLILAQDGTISLLEINTLPGLLPVISVFPKLCAAVGISYLEMVRMLIQSSSRTGPYHLPKLDNPPPPPTRLQEAVREAERTGWASVFLPLFT